MTINIAYNDFKNINGASHFFTNEILKEARAFHSSLPGYSPTPLRSLTSLSQILDVENIFVKDESFRFGLRSFKSLGASWAAHKQLQLEDNPVFAAATDGNHGRGLAWIADKKGCKAIIRMPKGSSPARVEEIRKLGAECLVTSLNYDDTIRELAAEASSKGWTLVQDTAWPGYETIPAWIMQGYCTLYAEIIDQLAQSNDQPPTHVFLQAGVGSFAAAAIAFFATQWKPVPKFILVEPASAACFYKSIRTYSQQIVTGELRTIMAGLACGKPNPLAWPIIQKHVLAFMSCPDWIAAAGTRILNYPSGKDPRIVAGESGAATTGALCWLILAKEAAAARRKTGIGKHSRVLLINTEGITDPESFAKIIWLGLCPAPPQIMAAWGARLASAGFQAAC